MIRRRRTVDKKGESVLASESRSTHDSRKGQFNVNSFFAGIGGFELGFEQAGFKPTFYCEKDKFCRSVLARHWPGIENIADISSVEASRIPEAEVWTGGFPCQDVSVARGWLGRDGLKGHRSGLFYKFYSLIRVRRPKVKSNALTRPTFG